MRQTADILSGKAAMQIRYLEAIQSMASSGNVKVVFLAEENWLIRKAHKLEYNKNSLLKSQFYAIKI